MEVLIRDPANRKAAVAVQEAKVDVGAPSGEGPHKPGIQLLIVPSENVFVHEYFDQQRIVQLKAGILKDRYVRDPPVVARIGESEEFVHLDGANRIWTLRDIGCRHLLVQVVDYYDDARVQLGSWCHVARLDVQHFLAEFDGAEDVVVEPIDLDRVGALSQEDNVLCCVFFGNRGVYGVFSETDDLLVRARLLGRVFNLYGGEHSRDLLDGFGQCELGGSVSEILQSHSEESLDALVAFPSFTPQQIVGLALANKALPEEAQVWLPPGITRHVIKPRALRVNFPLVILYTSKISLETKNAILDDFLKIIDPRPYEEPSLMYDERSKSLSAAR